MNEKIYNLALAIVKAKDIGASTKDSLLQELVLGSKYIERPASPDEPMIIRKQPGPMFTSQVEGVAAVDRAETDEELVYRNDPKHRANVNAIEKDLDKFNQEDEE